MSRAIGLHAQSVSRSEFLLLLSSFFVFFNHFFSPPPTKAQVSLVGHPVPAANHKWGSAHVSEHSGLAIGCPWPAQTRVCSPRSRSLGPSGTNKLLSHRFQPVDSLAAQRRNLGSGQAGKYSLAANCSKALEGKKLQKSEQRIMAMSSTGSKRGARDADGCRTPV